MTLEKLCALIELPEAVTARVLAVPAVPDGILAQLRTPELWPLGRAELGAFVRPDPDGFGELAGQLQCAVKTYELYRERGISDGIFVDTMKCFTRFVREHLESYGRYGFDRGFWTVRQLSGILFRIGELEYELREGEIHLHIPSDAVLEPTRLRSSWAAARAMLGEGDMVCHSWLLSPDLVGLLDDDSKILAFQRNFHIHSPAPDDSFRQWVFKNPNLPDEALPEATTLQRRLKAFLLAGNTFRAARGRLHDEPFPKEEPSWNLKN
ncbi:MAG: hypothetical protein E7451_00335 [Ruminococcaceae bacterium]|nr:hypothetical protein [Oscillospiraceae bacterium]